MCSYLWITWEVYFDLFYNIFLIIPTNCFYIISNSLNIAKLQNVSKSLHCHIITLSYNIQQILLSTRVSEFFYALSSVNITPQWSFSLTTLVAAFLIVWLKLRCKMSQSDSFSSWWVLPWVCFTNFWLNFFLIF